MEIQHLPLKSVPYLNKKFFAKTFYCILLTAFFFSQEKSPQNLILGSF
jgi:hypothetical protein